LIDDAGVITIFVFGIGRAFGRRLAIKRVEFPELILAILVKRMVVALRTLDCGSQEYLRCHDGRLHPPLVQFFDKKVDRPAEVFVFGVGTARGSD